MLRMRDIKDAKAAGVYYGKSDGGYYFDSQDLKREVGGKAAKKLGVAVFDRDEFVRLLSGLDPKTRNQLTAKLVEGRLAGWDFTATVPKSVTVALERGDRRIREAIWQAGRETMTDIEGMIHTRVRKGGEDSERLSRNMRAVF